VIELQPTIYRFFGSTIESLPVGVSAAIADRWGSVPDEIAVAEKSLREGVSGTIYLVHALGDSSGLGSFLAEAQSLRERSPEAEPFAVLLRRRQAPGDERIALRWIEAALDAGLFRSTWVISADDETSFLASLSEVGFARAIATRALAQSSPTAIGVASMSIGDEAPTGQFEVEFHRDLRAAIDRLTSQEPEVTSDAQARSILEDPTASPSALDAVASFARARANELRQQRESVAEPPSEETEAAAESSPEFDEQRFLQLTNLASLTGGALLGAVSATVLFGPVFAPVLLGALYGAIAGALLVPVVRNFSAPPVEEPGRLDEDEIARGLTLDNARREQERRAESALDRAARLRAALDALSTILPPNLGSSGAAVSSAADVCLREVCLAVSRDGAGDSEPRRIVDDHSRRVVEEKLSAWDASAEYERGTNWARDVFDRLSRSAAPDWPGGGGALVSLRTFSSDLETVANDGDVIVGGAETVTIARFARAISSADLASSVSGETRVA